ncbi:hypothetical protein LSAT2_003197 [Lamellibrachia satsuma]|nr:hypothetical protein LSAT2_003197 [Lamellibrachia satsuma]
MQRKGSAVEKKRREAHRLKQIRQHDMLGNYQNQLVVFDNKVCDYINYILRSSQFHSCSDKEDMKGSLSDELKTDMQELGFRYFHILCRMRDLYPGPQVQLDTPQSSMVWYTTPPHRRKGGRAHGDDLDDEIR